MFLPVISNPIYNTPMQADVREPIQVVDNRIRKIGDVIDFLKPRQVNSIQHYEFELTVDQNPISAAELQELTKLPYEVALTEKDGKVILNTGDKHGMLKSKGYDERKKLSKLSLHTHHEHASETDLNAPSFIDVLDTDGVSENTPLLLVSPTGIKIYQAPTYNPITNQEFRGDTRNLILEYGKAHGVDTFFMGISRTNLKKFSEMSLEEQVRFQTQFAIDTKMIEQEVPWSDPAGIQKMMDIVNLCGA